MRTTILSTVALSVLVLAVAPAFSADLTGGNEFRKTPDQMGPAPYIPPTIVPVAYDRGGFYGLGGGGIGGGISTSGVSTGFGFLGLGYQTRQDFLIEVSGQFNGYFGGWDGKGKFNGDQYGKVQTCGECGGTTIGQTDLNTHGDLANQSWSIGMMAYTPAFWRSRGYAAFGGFRLGVGFDYDFGRSGSASSDLFVSLNKSMFPGVTVPTQYGVQQYFGRTQGRFAIKGELEADVTRNVALAVGVKGYTGGDSYFTSTDGLSQIKVNKPDVTVYGTVKVRTLDFSGISTPVVARY